MELPINERWLSIDGYFRYSVSNCGRVRNDTTGRILRPAVGKHGYQFVCLSENGKVKTHLIHRLVANEWLDNLEDADHNQVDHIDRVKTNNHIGNLRWVTRSKNQRNRTTSKNNVSGKQGVCQRNDKGFGYWLVSIVSNDRVHIQKSFSIKKLGNDVAFARAVQCRKDLERQYGYIGM